MTANRSQLAGRRQRPRLMFVVTEDWYFVSHRLQLAESAIRSGFEVALATRVAQHERVIRDAGIELFPVPFDRSGTTPAREYATYSRLASIYRSYKPDLVHHVAMKPVIYGTMAARMAGVPHVVNAFGGLGYIFRSTEFQAKLKRGLATPILKFTLSRRGALVVVQNEDDRNRLVEGGLARDSDVRIIRGAGVEVANYPRAVPQRDPPLVILPARLLRDKGVVEFVEAARALKAEGVAARFALVGERDEANPACVTAVEVEAWQREGAVEVWGWREDMPRVMGEAQIVCLPSYHEGLPRVLLEAGASGCAIVATDIPGCREVVRNGETGWLVPVRDTNALVKALREAILRPDLRAQYGNHARDLVQRELSLERVVADTLSLYEELLQSTDASRRPPE